jgi:N-formylglutamate amidohydrolase
MSQRTDDRPAVDSCATAAFERHGPPQPLLPVLISAPHSGEWLPPEAEARLCLPPQALRELDDGPVHRLFEGAVAAGATLIVARYRRAFVDLNRDPLEIDPELAPDLAASVRPRLSLRVRAGLGVVPSRLGTRPLWRTPLGTAEIARRLHLAWFPYHRALTDTLEAMRRRFGIAVLLDVHSMPSSAAGDGGRLVDVALGDRWGCSAAPALVETALSRLQAAGLVCARNRPFAGGHITETCGRPRQGIHALQIEIRRALFMDEGTHRPHAGAARLAGIFAAVVPAVAAAALAGRPARAAPEVAPATHTHPGVLAAD